MTFAFGLSANTRRSKPLPRNQYGQQRGSPGLDV